MSVELFDRSYRLVVAPADGGPGIDVAGLRVVFDVKKTSTSDPNVATVEVYNLSSLSRERISQKDQGVTLEAGYTDLTRTIAVGVIKRVEHRREGVDIVSEIEFKDGGTDLLEPEFTRAYKSGTSRQKIVSDIIGTMPNTSRGPILATGVGGVTRGSLAFSTTCKLALDRLARAWDFEWSIQDGAIQILDREGTLDRTSIALSLSAESGLIGSPARTGQEGVRKSGSRSRKKRAGARFQSLLQPALAPGKLVILESEFISGSFKCQSVTHRGDTHGGDWTTEVEAIQL